MTDLSLDPNTTALVLIDLQMGIVGQPLSPHSGTDVIAKAASLADRFRELKSPVILVRVAPSADGKDMLKLQTDTQFQMRGPRPANWTELAPEIGPRDGDILIVKRQWGAFYGTDLDLQLRRRGVKTIVLGGIATNFGVESTARDAYERGYEQIFVEDAMSSLTPEAHSFVIQNIFGRMGRVRSAEEVLEALSQTASCPQQ